MGGRSLGDRQDRIIGGFHHGGALALREPRKSQRSLNAQLINILLKYYIFVIIRNFLFVF
jgi:hypothetical protein